MADHRPLYRTLPAVEALLLDDELSPARTGADRGLLRELVRAELEAARARIAAGLQAEALAQWLASKGPVRAVLARLGQERGAGMRRAINATGVVLNTGLGRAPWHPEAADAARAVAAGYGVVEVDRASGERNQRDDRASQLLTRLLPCESALVVNNCAAAVLLCLSGLSAGRETLLSRGELVEIGGSFRMPAVMERAGVRLVEVGTTNRTRLSDYQSALGPSSALLLKVHPSNFRIRGFTEDVPLEQLAALARAHGLYSAYDLGSGRVDLPGTQPLDMLGDEPDVARALSSGVDVVLFSGDKLLGGPQAGFVVGRAEVVKRLRSNPLYRALRLDKTILAGVERTLEILLAGRADELPARALLHRKEAELAASARALADGLSRLPGLSARVVAERSQPGSGSAPDVFLPTFAVVLSAAGYSAAALAHRLRALPVPVFARIHAGEVLLDPRTLLPGEERELLELLRAHPFAPGPDGP